MARTATIIERVLECAPALIAAPWTAIIGIILVLDRIFDVFLGTGVPASVTIQRLGGVPVRRSRSAESDIARVQYILQAMLNRAPALVGAELVEGERNPAMRPVGHQPPELVHAMVHRSNGVYAGVNETNRGRRAAALDRVTAMARGLRYQSDYRPGQLGSKTMGIVPVQHRENEE